MPGGTGGPPAARARMRASTSRVVSARGRRVLAICAVCTGGAVLLLAAAYAVGGYVVYDRLSAIGSRPEDAANTPASFSVHRAGFEHFDTSPYRMATFEDVRLPSRQAGVELAGWFVPGGRGAGAVVVVHGLGDSRRRHSVLLPAGILARAGFSVLLVDIREHGDSQMLDGRTALGTEEYLDVLGAWDWLTREKGFPAERVGLFGVSMGAATVLIAMGEEPRVPAAFVDSPFSDIRTVIREELAREGYPEFLASGGTAMARVTGGPDLHAQSPEGCIAKLGDRALSIAHGLADGRVGPHHARRLSALAEARGRTIETWLVPRADHLDAMLMFPSEYAARLVGFFQQTLAE